MKIVLAISGGVDSMLMLKMLHDFFYSEQSSQLIGPQYEYVVAHYNHKMRPSADADAEFVRKWAKHYGFIFYYGEALPGEIKSEEQARKKRYEFLRGVAGEERGKIVTAHHVNDLVETVAINLLRGTGWRGLAPFSDNRTYQFFFEFTHSKREICQLAAEHQIVFRQDPTNCEDDYLRNRVRKKTGFLSEDVLHKIWGLYTEQLELSYKIDSLVGELLPRDGKYFRKWFAAGEPLGPENDLTALEFLRAALKRAGVSATRPQILDFLAAIRTYAPSKKFNLPGDKLVTLYKDYFVL